MEPTKKPIEVSKEILIKTTEMTEDAYKSERDRANQLGDVSKEHLTLTNF